MHLLFIPIRNKKRSEEKQELSLHLSADAFEKRSNADNERGTNENPQTIIVESSFSEEEKALLESSCAEGNRTTSCVTKVGLQSTPEVLEVLGRGRRRKRMKERRRDRKMSHLAMEPSRSQGRSVVQDFLLH